MKTAIRLALLALAVGIGAAPSPAASGTGTFVYVHDRGTVDQIFGFALAQDGTLEPLADSPFAGPPSSSNDCGGYCETFTYSKKRKMIFSSHNAGIVAWTVAKDGALSLVQAAPAGSGTHYGVAAVQRGRRTFVYSGLYGDDQVAGYEVGADGIPVALPGSPWAAGQGALGTRAVGNRLVVANQNDPSLSSWIVGKDGSLTAAPGSPAATAPDGTWHVDIDPKGKFVYNGTGGTGVLAFQLDRKTAELTPFPAGPLPTDLSSCEGGLAFSKKLAAVCASGPSLQVFKREKDGSLTSLGLPQDTGAAEDIQGHSFDRTGRILALAFESKVQTFSVDPVTGVITFVDGETIAADSVNDLLIARP
jgi:hypothetical protein